MILVRKFGWDRDSSHGPSRKHPGLRLHTSREPQGRAPYYIVLQFYLDDEAVKFLSLIHI